MMGRKGGHGETVMRRKPIPGKKEPIFRFLHVEI
jgi:hypothetical protein